MTGGQKKKKVILLVTIALIISAVILLYINPNTREVFSSAIMNTKAYATEILTPSNKPEVAEETKKTSLLKNIFIGESEIQGFEPNKLNYEIMLNNKPGQITIKVEKQDENENVTGIGTIKLTGNSQKQEIKVTSSDKKSTTIYTVTIKYKQSQEIDKEDKYLFSYIGDKQEFIAPKTGYYQFECWGAKGGSYSAVGGNGAYTSGNIYLEKGQKLYVYVGQAGGNLITKTYNGGGSAGTSYSCRSRRRSN